MDVIEAEPKKSRRNGKVSSHAPFAIKSAGEFHRYQYVGPKIRKEKFATDSICDWNIRGNGFRPASVAFKEAGMEPVH